MLVSTNAEAVRGFPGQPRDLRGLSESYMVDSSVAQTEPRALPGAGHVAVATAEVFAGAWGSLPGITRRQCVQEMPSVE